MGLRNRAILKFKLFIIRFYRGPWVSILDKYILSEFFSVLFLCLLASTGLFLVFETFERFKLFLSNNVSFFTAASYFLYKTPLILQLMIPIAALVATLISIGKLSQKSEITAMRSCSMSVQSIARPILFSSLLLSILMFLNGEFLLPYATEKVEQILQFEIKQKHLSDSFSRTNFWFREGNTFINVGFYNAPDKRMDGVTKLVFDADFNLEQRIDAQNAKWNENPIVGWTLSEAIESGSPDYGYNSLYYFKKLPLITSKTPEELYDLQRSSETFTYQELKRYIKKLENEGVSVKKYKVDLATKISFPFVCLIATLVGLPFAFTSARSGSLTISFIGGVSVGFAYYVTHAILSSFAAAGFIPVLLGAWSANILLGSVGLYLLGGAEFKH